MLLAKSRKTYLPYGNITVVVTKIGSRDSLAYIFAAQAFEASDNLLLHAFVASPELPQLPALGRNNNFSAAREGTRTLSEDCRTAFRRFELTTYSPRPSKTSSLHRTSGIVLGGSLRSRTALSRESHQRCYAKNADLHDPNSVT